MKRLMFAVGVLCAGLAFAQDGKKDPFTGGDPQAGAAKAATCFACHGPNGNSSNPEWPKLAGQSSAYIVAQLKAFACAQQQVADPKAKCEPRSNPIMQPQAAMLSDQDRRDLGAYFAAQQAAPGVASPQAVKVAQKLFRAGDAGRGIPACAACHGANGLGNPAAAYPRLSGQQTNYVANQLRAFRSGERKAGANGQIMATVAAKLTDAEIDALASYVSGLQ